MEFFKKIYKQILIVGTIFIGIMLFSTVSEAAGTISLKASKTSPIVGEEFNISVNLSGASVATLTAKISIDTSKIEYVSGPANTNFSNGRIIYTWTDPSGGENPKTSGTIATFKVKAKTSGTATFSISGDFYTPDEKAVNPSFSGTTVTIKEKETVNPTTPPATGGDSSGNTGTSSGGNTGTSGGENAGNNGGTTSGGSQAGGSTNQNGSSNNSGGSTQKLSNNANLKELHLNVEGLSPAFQKTVTKYNLVIGENINEISVNAIPEQSGATVNVKGNTNLKTGINEIRITVTAEDKKTTKTYIIQTTKTENPSLANANLENLAIENVTLNPEFNTDITEYNAVISSDVENINLLAIPQIEGAKVEVTGADNLQFGDNTIVVKVIAQNGISTKEYVIKLYKTTKEEEENNEIMLINNDENNMSGNEVEEGNNIKTRRYGICYYSNFINCGRDIYNNKKIYVRTLIYKNNYL